MRVVDSTIASLQAIRNDIDNQDEEALKERLERARQGREKWWQQRQAGEWLNGEGVPTTEAPTSSDIFGRLLGLSRKPKNKK